VVLAAEEDVVAELAVAPALAEAVACESAAPVERELAAVLL
jgi:hypothetical protein